MSASGPPTVWRIVRPEGGSDSKAQGNALGRRQPVDLRPFRASYPPPERQGVALG